jgi:hypothetical protein
LQCSNIYRLKLISILDSARKKEIPHNESLTNSIEKTLKVNINALVSAVLILAVSITLVLVTFETAENLWSYQWLSIFGIALGCYTLGKLRPQRLGLSPPHVMLSLGFGGMLAGLLVDIELTPIATIASICSGSHSLSLMDSLELHMRLMPFMHIGMLVGGIAAIPSLRYLRPQCRKLCSMFAQNILCSTWMLLGMTLGAVIFTQVLQQREIQYVSLSMMLAGMFTGMVWGMVISVLLYRQYFNCVDFFYRSKASRLS